MTTIAHLRDLSGFVARLDEFDVPRSAAIDKAFALEEHVATLHARQPLPDNLLDLDPDQVTEVWRNIALTVDPRMTGMASDGIRAKLWELAREALHEHVPVILKALRPQFDAAAKAVSKAAAAGIQPTTDAQGILDLQSPAAVAAWQTLAPSADALTSIARLWVDLCESLDLPPNVTHAARMIGERPDWTVCFVHPDTKLTRGYHIDGNAQLRWLSLAIATGGRLRLNSPEEADRLLNGEGDSPGWIICAAGCVVTDDDGRQLQLYRGAWLPTWVPTDQVDRLVDAGFVVAAKPDAARPADKYPIGSESAAVRRRPVTGELVVQ